VCGGCKNLSVWHTKNRMEERDSKIAQPQQASKKKLGSPQAFSHRSSERPTSGERVAKKDTGGQNVESGGRMNSWGTSNDWRM